MRYGTQQGNLFAPHRGTEQSTPQGGIENNPTPLDSAHVWVYPANQNEHHLTQSLNQDIAGQHQPEVYFSVWPRHLMVKDNLLFFFR